MTDTRYTKQDVLDAMQNAGFTKKQRRKLENALPECSVCWDTGTVEHDQFSMAHGHYTTEEACICQDPPAGSDRLTRSAVLAAIRRNQ